MIDVLKSLYLDDLRPVLEISLHLPNFIYYN